MILRLLFPSLLATNITKPIQGQDLQSLNLVTFAHLP